jgi:hypothetical protein
MLFRDAQQKQDSWKSRSVAPKKPVFLFFSLTFNLLRDAFKGISLNHA